MTVSPCKAIPGRKLAFKKFLNQGKETREEILKKMQPIVGDIFRLWIPLNVNFGNGSKIKALLWI